MCIYVLSADVMTEFHDPRVAATNFLIDVVRLRTAQSLDRVLTQVGSILTQYTASPVLFFSFFWSLFWNESHVMLVSDGNDTKITVSASDPGLIMRVLLIPLGLCPPSDAHEPSFNFMWLNF
jgi:hypothetical protein